MLDNDSLRSRRLQHTRLSCPSLSPRTCSNLRPLSRWCHPTISSSIIPFSSCLQSLPASGSFPVSVLFTSGGQSIGVSALASVLPINIQGWFPLWLTGLISLLSKGCKILLQHHSSKASVLWHSAFFAVHLSYLYMTTGKTIALTIRTFLFSFFRHLFIYLTYSCLLTHSDNDDDNGCINQGKIRKSELMPDRVLERIYWVGQKNRLGFL